MTCGKEEGAGTLSLSPLCPREALFVTELQSSSSLLKSQLLRARVGRKERLLLQKAGEGDLCPTLNILLSHAFFKGRKVKQSELIIQVSVRCVIIFPLWKTDQLIFPSDATFPAHREIHLQISLKKLGTEEFSHFFICLIIHSYS